MKKPFPDGSMEGPNGLKAFAKLLVNQYSLGADAARFSVVSFASDATTRVPWSHDAAQINAGIDQMTADGKTSISDAFEAARQLFVDDGRQGVAKFVLFISDGDQTVDAAPGKSLLQTAVDAATLVKGDGVTVFAWGIGKANLTTLEEIATDPSKAILAQDIAELTSYLVLLEAAVCNHSPPVSPPSPPVSPPSPPMPPQARPAECGKPDSCPSERAGLRDPDELHEVRLCNASHHVHVHALCMCSSRPYPRPGAVLLRRLVGILGIFPSEWLLCVGRVRCGLGMRTRQDLRRGRQHLPIRRRQALHHRRALERLRRRHWV